MYQSNTLELVGLTASLVLLSRDARALALALASTSLCQLTLA